jgi:type I restriction enzyme, S subunit
MLTFPRYDSYKDSGVPWIGEIPANWETQKLKFCADLNRLVLPESTDKETIIEYVDISSVTQGKIERSETFRFKDAPSRARRIAEIGDTIVSTVRTYLKAIAYIDDNSKGKVFSTGFSVISPKAYFNPRYFSYFCQSDLFVNEVVSESKGVSFPAITSLELGNFHAIIPSIEEQEHIARFLDEKTAAIDDAIAKKRRLIELLQEQKGILINTAVTQGLDPNVPMKESGVEWIGRIPAHWEVKRAKFLFQEVDERSEAGVEELLSVSHMTGVTPRSEKNVSMFMAEDYTGSKLCRNNDLVFNIMWAWMGALGVSDRTGIVSSSYGVYRQQSPGTFNPWYLEQLLRSSGYVAEYNRRSTGLHSSRLRLYPHMFLDMEISIPPRQEQDEIELLTSEQISLINQAIHAVEMEMEKLGELRAILISEAVTGKIKV